MQIEATDIGAYVDALGRRARAASRLMASATTASRNAALRATAEAIRSGAQALCEANARDLEARPEERRVGKECRSRWAAWQSKEKNEQDKRQWHANA